MLDLYWANLETLTSLPKVSYDLKAAKIIAVQRLGYLLIWSAQLI